MKIKRDNERIYGRKGSKLELRNQRAERLKNDLKLYGKVRNLEEELENKYLSEKEVVETIVEILEEEKIEFNEISFYITDDKQSIHISIDTKRCSDIIFYVEDVQKMPLEYMENIEYYKFKMILLTTIHYENNELEPAINQYFDDKIKRLLSKAN